MEYFFYPEINDAYHHAMKTEDEHGADWDKGDQSTLNAVESLCEVDEGDDWYEVDYII